MKKIVSIWLHVIACIFISATIFSFDLSTELGIAVPILYCVLVLYAILIKDKYSSLYLSGVALLLIFIGFNKSPEVQQDFHYKAIVNRLLSSAIIVVLGYIIYQVKKLRRDLINTTEIKLNNQKLKSSQSLAKLGSWDWNLKNNDISWSNELYKIYGLTPKQDASFGAADDFIHPEDKERVIAVSKVNYKNKSAFRIEYRIIDNQGELKHVVENVEVVNDKNGNAIGMFGIVLDVTKLKETAIELEQKIGSLTEFESRTNHILNALINITQGEYLTKINISDRGDELDAIALGINTLSEELAISIAELKDRNQKLIVQQEELQSTNEELEEHARKLKDQREELEASNEEMEEQRKLILKTNEELRKKATELNQTNQYKSDFLANMSHELRSPLNSILLLANDLSYNTGNNLNEDQVQSAKIIYEGGKDLLHLINDILDLSKIEAGKLETHIESVELSNLLHEIKTKYEIQTKAKQLDFEVILSSDLETNTLRTDEVRLKQILNNLLSNAIKFTSKGTVKLEIRPSGKEEFEIVVSDSGIGIPKEKQALIFDSFIQADGSTSRKYGGTGLGLAITSYLVQMLGGKISLKSELKKGSTFTVTVPYKTAKKQTKSQKSESKNPTSNKTDFTPKSNNDGKLLIIEDDPVFSSILIKKALEMGFTPISAPDGKTAIDNIETESIAAILLDLGLPDMNGLEIIDYLNQKSLNIPIHIISAQDRPEGIENKNISFIPKPVLQEDLHKAFLSIDQFGKDSAIKHLLIVEDHIPTRSALRMLLKYDDLKIIETSTITEASKILNKQKIDCIILDINLPDGSGKDLINKHFLNKNKTPPWTIVYTNNQLSEEEATEIKSWAKSIVVKGEYSNKRLIDEAVLFLNQQRKNGAAEISINTQNIETQSNKNRKLNGKRVLLVDDDMRNMFALSKVLSERGLLITKATNGKKAIEAIASADFDIILMDIMMPEMDGFEAIKVIRTDHDDEKLPIIALTAKAMKGDKEKCLSIGANDYLPKPVNVEKLLNLMSIWIN